MSVVTLLFAILFSSSQYSLGAKRYRNYYDHFNNLFFGC